MEAAEKLSVTVTAEQARRIRQLVKHGSYASTSEVVRAGLRALDRDEERHQSQLNIIRQRVQEAIDDPRPAVPLAEGMSRVRAHIAAVDE
jgi:antitoxin ParD1/3/4